MYCSKCGTYMSDADKFCPNCGTSIDGQPSPAVVTDPKPAHAPRKKLSKKALIGILAGAGAVVIAVVLILIFTLGGSNSPEGVFKKFFNAYANLDLQGMLDSSVPDEVLEYVLQDEGMSRSEFQRQLRNAQAEIDSYRKEYGEYYQRFRDITVVGSSALDRDDLEKLNAYYNRNFKTGKYYITEAREVSVRLNYGYGFETEEFVVFKVNGKWYVSLQDAPNVLDEII
ncbi:MAG: zinc-ribbon domain-containing protein [Clostridia bacterium]|nr:zinc-ribbon domain-containing protein [Clostridia bacterium]